MKLIDWYKERTKKLEWFDIGLIEGACCCFGIFIALIALPFVSSLCPKWYLIFGLAFAIRPIYAFYFKK